MCYRGRVLRKFVEVIRNVLSKGDWVMGKQVRKLLVFVLLAGIMTGCVGGGLVDPIPKYYTVSGKIVERETGKPLGDALVLFEPGGIRKTTATGEFEYTTKENLTISPVSAGWTYEPSSLTVMKGRNDIIFTATPMARTEIYEDEYVRIEFIGCEPSYPYGSRSELVFNITNKTNVELTFQSDSFALDGVSLGYTSGSDSVAAKSTGLVRFRPTEVFPTMLPSFLTGNIKVIDFSRVLLERTYQVDFVNVVVVY